MVKQITEKGHPEAEVLYAIIRNPGITLTNLRKYWPNSRRKEVDEALRILLDLAPPLIDEHKERAHGSSATRYFLWKKNKKKGGKPVHAVYGR